MTSRSPSLLVSWSPSIGGIAAAVALGWIAAKLNVAGFAPVGLLPLFNGIMLGGSICVLVALNGVPRRSQLVFGTIALAILTVLAEHAWLYHDFCRQWREARANQAQVAMFRPESPWSPAEYFAREASPSRVALWCVDASVLVASAVGTVMIWRRVIERSASQVTRPT